MRQQNGQRAQNMVYISSPGDQHELPPYTPGGWHL